MKTEFGIIGLGVMGKSLARNFARHDISLALYNRHVDGVEENVALNFKAAYSELSSSQAYNDLEAFVYSLETPRRILIMVNAGNAVDTVIQNLLKYIEPNDILIDGGNSHYKNTNQRNELLSKKGIHFIGMGISGGEEGALIGPSLMPGGNLETYQLVKHYLQKIAAKDKNGHPCCEYIGREGSGHFVKMAHNGIEYAEMQLIAETYSLLRFVNGFSPNKIASIFEVWNTGSIKNYLLEITTDILRKKEGELFLIDAVLDKSSHKGTGSWTTIAAAELGVPFTMSSAALNARYMSSLKDIRVKLSEAYNFKKTKSSEANIDALKNAYQLARIVNHHQGLELIRTASAAYNWNIELTNVTSVWTNGCIIASELMKSMVSILESSDNILLSKNASLHIEENFEDLKESVLTGIKSSIPLPCLSESLNYLSAMKQSVGTGNIIQAQRDYFGAHTYKRTDDPEGPSHHTNWKN